MTKGARRPNEEEPPSDWTPTQAVEDPVVNSPYQEPTQHWVYQKGGSVKPFLTPGRRPASYWYKSQKTGTVQTLLYAEEERDDLPLVNRFRNDVKRWRESGYRGASPVTKELFAWWSRTDRHRPLFFCQREAAETIIYLLEIALPGRLASTGFKSFEKGVDAANLERLLAGVRPDFPDLRPDQQFFPRLVDPSSDGTLLPLRRLGCKMATGSGKTIVMAMIISWAFCNRGRNPATTSFPNGVLVCAPNVTVRNRLSVLKPEDPENYYDQFDIVPAKYREALGSGRVLVTNWHALALKSEHSEGGQSYRVVNKGEESPEAFAKDRLGDLANRLPILVLNDEGHHCWRPAESAEKKALEKGLTPEQREALEEEVEEARVWLAGLDRINNAGILGEKKACVGACVDLSATPFYLGGSGHPEGSPFPWLVEDFGLVDAIESGIVKIPRLPVRDDQGKKDEVGRPDPKYFRLWRHIDENLKPTDRYANGRPKPDPVFREAEGALQMLAGQWKLRLQQIEAASPGQPVIPPVLIVVCDNTEIAEVLFRQVSGESTVEVPSEDGKGTTTKTIYNPSATKIRELANEEGVRRTIRIDTKLLAKIEVEEGETKDEAALALRQVINTVGKRGQPGEHVRCVVSVGMLTEGWDATNVTHILGLRAFGSQLLCEQVVGRGLRRMNYTPDPKTGLLPAEYVDVYGIPFSLIPFKGKPRDDKNPDPVHHHVFAVADKANFEIRMPIVESYTFDLKGAGIRCDVEKLEGFIVEDEPTEVYVTPARGYQDAPTAAATGEFVKQDRKEFYATVWFDQILFRIAQLIVEDLLMGYRGHKAEHLQKALFARQQLFPAVLKIVKDYVEKKVRYAKDVDPRELALEKYVTLLRERIREGIFPENTTGDVTILPVVNSFKPFASTADVNYRTIRPVVPLARSHLNLAVLRSDLERDAIEKLESLDCVDYFTPNDRNVGLVIPYEYLGASAYYEPDFVVRLRGGRSLILEIKGVGGEIHDEDRVNAKNAAAKKWVTAVNNAGRYGTWAFEICRDLSALQGLLEAHASGEPPPPFQIVTPTDGDRWKTCIPLVDLRAAAGGWSEDQARFDPDASWAKDWITFAARTPFEHGMFVARVYGDSMTPDIKDRDYCLFRQPRPGSRHGRRLLVWHAGVLDPHTGGRYTLKVYESEKVQDGEGGWKHSRITLRPLNPAYPPIVLNPQEEGEVRVIAEFVEVVHDRPTSAR